jgi:glycerol-1-phosphate dehydrogenase [NAD(P)+]
MQLPREVIVGEGVLEFVGTVCKKLGFCESALVVSGPKTWNVAGQSVFNLLNDMGVDASHIIVSFSMIRSIEEVEEKIKQLKPNVTFGVGGGTKIDVTKLGSVRQKVPFISVPTMASHDGIASSLASLKGLQNPYSSVAQAPMAIIADTTVITQAEHRFTASGCGDVLAKFTAVRDWNLARRETNEYYGEYAASLALMSAKLVRKNAALIKPGNKKGVRVLLEALISCGVAMSIAGSSRPGSGSEHLFSHALDMVAPKPAMHGEQCGVGTIMMMYLHGLNWKGIKKTLQKVGAPTTAEELGVEPEYIVKALVQARSVRPERYTILNKKRLTYDSAKKLAKSTGVID